MNEQNQNLADPVERIKSAFLSAKTPTARLRAVLFSVTALHDWTADRFNDGSLGSRHAKTVMWISDRLIALKLDPPSNFVDLIALAYDFAKDAAEMPLDDEQREAVTMGLAFLHALVFTPPEALAHDTGVMASDLQDFAAFVKEFREETDRGAALVGAALIDFRLERLLHNHFLDGEIANRLLSNSADAPLGGFSSRAKMCYALGLVTRVEYEECDIIRRVRNTFAHQLHGLTFADQQITDWCKNLKATVVEAATARQRFVNSVISLCMVLWYRPAHAASLKAREREWPWRLG